jgi:predicted transcriptional regulator
MRDEEFAEVVKRLPVLEALRDGPHGTAELTDRLPLSRSTVHRATNALADLGLVERRDGKIELTSVGRIVTRRLSDCRRDVDTAERLAPFLDAVGSEIDVPLDLLADATVSRPDRGQAHFAVKRLSDLVSGSDSLRMLSAVVSPMYVDICCREATAGTAVRAVFDREVVDILFDEYASESREAIEHGTLEIRIHDDCPFELFLFDDVVGMTVQRAHGSVAPFVESSDPEVYEWAESLFERYDAAAEFATLF